jgi:RNA polymerase sigma-70 factor (ECF subfamily)
VPDPEVFEEHRPHLRAVALRLLGSAAEADDAVQEAWLRFSRADTSGVHNIAGWLTTVVSRVSLDALRSRASRREQPAGWELPEPRDTAIPDPQEEAQLADSVGRALLVVLAPDVVRRADPIALRPGAATVVRGAREVAAEARTLSRQRARHAEPALVNGAVGAIVAPGGRLVAALVFTIEGGRITSYEVIADPARLAGLDVAVLGQEGPRKGGRS